MAHRTDYHYSGIPATAPFEFVTNVLFDIASRLNTPKQVEKSSSQAAKIAAWALIGGAAYTMYTLYQAKQTNGENSPRSNTGAFLRGSLAGGSFKAALSSGMIQEIAQVPFTIASRILQQTPRARDLFINTPYRLGRWLIT